MIYLQEVTAFIHALQTGKVPFTREELVKPVAVINAIEESVRLGGKEVPIE